MLHYFGESYNAKDGCGSCDNCLHPKEKIDVKDSVKIILDAINELEEHFGINYVVDMVLGNATPQITTFRHDKLKCFGSGKVMKMEPNFWQSLIRQMLLEGFIRKGHRGIWVAENGRTPAAISRKSHLQ